MVQEIRLRVALGELLIPLAHDVGKVAELRDRLLDAQLNQRGQQLVGRRLTLDAPLVNGRGHVRVGDSSWPVIADEDFAAGSKVEVIAVEGITLRIRPAVR